MSESCYAPWRKWVLSFQQCRFYWRDETLLRSLKDKGVKYVRGLEEPGNPWCANHSFLLGFPWWMLSAWLLFLSASEPQGFSLVISSFLSFPSRLQLFVSSLLLKPYLVAGILTFTDRSLCHWGLSRPPRLASKTAPPHPPQWGSPSLPSSSVTWNQPLSRTVSCIISCFSCSARPLQQIHSFLSTELWSV